MGRPTSVLHRFRLAIEQSNVAALHLAYAGLRTVAIQLKDPLHASSHTQAQVLSEISVDDIRAAMKLALHAAARLFRPAKSREENAPRRNVAAARQDGMLARQMFDDMTTLFGFTPDARDCRRSVLGCALDNHSASRTLNHLLGLRSTFEDYRNASYDAESIVILHLCTKDEKGLRVAERLRTFLVEANVKLDQIARDTYLRLLFRVGKIDKAKEIAQNDTNGASLLPLSQQSTCSLTKFLKRIAGAGVGDWPIALQMADEVLQRAREDKSAVSNADWKGLLFYTGVVKGPTAALDMAKDARRRGLLQADEEVFTLLLLSHEEQLRNIAQGGTEEDVMRLFARIEDSCHVSPSSDSYTVAMRALLGLQVPSLLSKNSHKSDRQNLQIMSAMKIEDEAGAIPAVSRRSVPKYTPGQVHEASLLYQRLKAYGLQPTQALVSSLLVAYASSYIPQVDRALELYRDWRSCGRELEAEAYNILLLACAKARDIKTAQQILQDMIKQGVLLKHRALTDLVILMMEASHSYDAAHEVYCRVRDAAEKLNESVQSSTAPKKAIFDEGGWLKIIDRYSKLQFSQESLPPANIIMEMFSEMRACGFAPEPKQFTTLLRMYGRSATQALQQIQHLDPGDKSGHKTIFSKVEEVTEAIDIIHKYLQREESVEPDLILITALMDAYNRVNRSRNALEIWHRLLLTKVDVDSACIAVVLDTCGHAGLIQEGRRVWEWVQKSDNRKQQCNKGVWDAWVECLARCGNLLEAIDTVFVEMQPALRQRGEGQGPDAKTMEMLLRFASAERHQRNRESSEDRYYLLGHLKKRVQAEMPDVWDQVENIRISL